MIRYVIVCLLCITGVKAFGQNPTVQGRVKMSQNGTMGLDTNKLAVDEKGNKLQFYQYKKLLLSAEYGLVTQDSHGFPLAEYLLKKKDGQRNLQLYEMVKKQMAINSTMLQEGNKLSVEPLAAQISPDKFDNKVILLMFISPDCQQCMTDIDDLGKFVKQVYDPNKIIWVAVAHGDESPERIQSLRSLLPYAYLLLNYNKIYEGYWADGLTTGYVIADKDHTIRFSVKGQGGIVPAVFKSKLTEILK